MSYKDEETRMEPMGEAVPHPETDELELSAVLHALSDDVRLQIVRSIAEGGECAMGGIDVPVTKSTCTHHFKVLREAGIIRQRQVGTARMTTLRREDLDARFPGVLDSILSAAGAPS
jgi:DNA-binding transcriptional ArsR family regulator